MQIEETNNGCRQVPKRVCLNLLLVPSIDMEVYNDWQGPLMSVYEYLFY